MRIPDHRILLGKLFNDNEIKKQIIEESICKISKHVLLHKILEDTWNEKINNHTLDVPNIYFVPHWVINGFSHQTHKLIRKFTRIFNGDPEIADINGYYDKETNSIFISIKNLDIHATFTHEVLHYVSVNKKNSIRITGFKSNSSWDAFDEVCTDYFSNYIFMDGVLNSSGMYRGPYVQLNELINLVGIDVFFKWYLYGKNQNIVHLFTNLGKMDEATLLYSFDEYMDSHDPKIIADLQLAVNKISKGYKKEMEA